MNHKYTEHLRHLIRVVFIDGLRNFTILDEKSVDCTYRECIDEVRAAIEVLDYEIYGDNGQEPEPLDIETIKYVLSLILEGLGNNTARSKRVQILMRELNIFIDKMKFGEELRNAKWH